MFSNKGAFTLFFGANIAIPQTKDISTGINAASAAIQQFSSSLCTVTKTILKFSNTPYVNAGNALTDVSYLFQDMQSFYTSLLTCFNDQSQSTTATATVRSLNNLIYQVNVYILAGISMKLSTAATTLGGVFGSNAMMIVQNISTSYTAEFTTVLNSLTTLVTNFNSVINSGSAVTPTALAAALDTGALNSLVQVFQDIKVTSNQMAMIIAGLTSVTQTLDTVSSSVQIFQSNATGTITQATYQSDVSVQAAKTLFQTSISTYQTNITGSFAQWSSLAAAVFVGDTDIQASRVIVDSFSNSVKQIFETIAAGVVRTFTSQQGRVNAQIQTLKSFVTTSTQSVNNYLTSSVLQNSAGFVKCLGPTTANAASVAQLIQTLGANASSCIGNQQNISLQAQSLMTFIVQDTVLNVNGAADTLCGCTVGTSAVDVAAAKACIKKVS